MHALAPAGGSAWSGLQTRRAGSLGLLACLLAMIRSTALATLVNATIWAGGCGAGAFVESETCFATDIALGLPSSSA